MPASGSVYYKRNQKRDFPPSLFISRAGWENYGKFNDYFARLGMILTRGGAGAEVLLLHPMRSGWMLYDGEAEGKIADFGQRFEELSQYLSDIHIGIIMVMKKL